MSAKRSDGHKRRVRAAAATVEAIERRLLFAVTTLSAGSGDGAASVTVDAFGAFGAGASPASDLLYDVAGAGGLVGTVFQSALYMSAAGDGGDFLAEADLGRGVGGFNPLSFDSTDATNATSTFNVGVFTVVLTQTLFAGTGSGSAFLFQTYSITNNNEVNESLRLVRNVDADPLPGNGNAELGYAQTGATYAASNSGNQAGGVFVFAFDSGSGGGADPSSPTLNGYAVRSASGSFADVIQNGGLPSNQFNVVAGDNNGDHFTDTAYDLALALQTDFPSIAPGETVTYTATTFVGDGTPSGQPPLPVKNPGDVDSITTIPIAGPPPDVTDLKVQRDDKIVVVGTVTQSDDTKDLAVFRINPDGTTDTTFGNNGLVVTDVSGLGFDDSANAVALQGDKILIVGTVSNDPNNRTASDYFVTRYNPDGTLDTTFGNDAPGLTIADFSDPFSSRSAISDASSIAVAPDGSFIVAGTTDALDTNGDMAIVRYTADGVPVTSFGDAGTGRVIVSRPLSEVANSVAIQADGKIVLAGRTVDFSTPDPLDPTGSVLLVRYNPDGSLDTSFGTGGFVTTDVRDSIDSAKAVIATPDGKLLVSGTTAAGRFDVTPGGDLSSANLDLDFLLARYNSDGSLDSSFGTGGVTTTNVPDVLATATKLAIDPAGRIVAVGTVATDFNAANANQFGTAIARYLPNGALDTTFANGGIQVIPFSQISGQFGASATTDTSSLLTAALNAAGVGPAAVEASPGAEAIRQQALIALSAQGKLDILLTSGGQVRLAQVTGDAGAPTATVALLPSVTDPTQTEATFVIRYEDDFAIDAGTLGNGDILVTDPAGATTAAELVSVDAPGNGTPRTATYRYRPAGGAFANGNYALSVGTDEVKDTSGRSLTAGPIANATFAVNLITDGPNLNAAGPVTGKLPASVVGGGKASGASLLVRNTGTQPAVGLVQVRVVASADNVFNDSDAEVVTFSQKVNLKVGAAKPIKLKFKTFPANLPDGDYFLLAKVDNANAFAEISEGDNVGSTANKIRIAAPFVDLGFAGGISGFKSPLAPGKNGSLAVPLRNNGNIPAKATVSANLFASLDQTMSGDDRSLGTVPVKASLKASTTKNTKLKFTLPADLAPGQYFLILVLNPAGNDRDASDNTAVSAVPLTVG